MHAIDIVEMVARILFVLIFVMGGIGHLTKSEAMAGYAQMKKVPLPTLSVQASGILMILGGLSILLGVWGDLGALVIAVLMVVTPVMMHNFWTLDDPQARAGDQAHFNKDIALAGGALAFFVIYHIDRMDWAITGPLFN